MASLSQRKNPGGSISWRVIFRRRGKKTLCFTFLEKEEAQDFILKHEKDYLLNEHIITEDSRRMMRWKREIKNRGL